MPLRVTLAWSVTLASLLVACGGGGGGNAPATDGGALAVAGNPAEGLWGGSLPLAPAVLAILDNGDTWGYYEGPTAYGAMHGSTTASGTSFSSDLTDYDLLSDVRLGVHLTGTATPRSSLDATAANGARILFSYRTSYDRPASSAELAGTYQLSNRAGNAVLNGALTIDGSGRFSVLDSGCTVSGSAVPRLGGTSVFNLTVLFSGNCFLGNGATGTGVLLLDTMANPPTLAAMAVVPGNERGFFAFGTKGTVPPASTPAPTASPAPTRTGSGTGSGPAPSPVPTPAPSPPPTPAPLDED